MPSVWNAKKVFTFVFKEMERIQEDLRQGKLSTMQPQDVLACIPDPRFGARIIGIKAEYGLQELARQTINSDEYLSGRLHVNELVRLFKGELAKVLSGADEREAQKIVADCVAEAKANISKIFIFYIPCLLPDHSMIAKFRVGSISFHRKNRIISDKNLLSDCSGEIAEGFNRQKEIFNWIAEVRIDGFSEDLARDRAYLFVRFAVAAIKMGFSDRISKWLGTDRQLLPSHMNYSITQRDAAPPYVGCQRRFFLPGSDEQVSHMLSNGWARWLQTIGGFFDHYIKMGNFGFLGNRIITALTWFDTGCSAISDAEKVVAYSNCLEALFVTSDKGIKQQLRERAGPLLVYGEPDTDWLTGINRFYDVRSDLVHGVISPFALEVRQEVEFGFDISSASIQVFLAFCQWLLAKFPVESTPRHLSPFNGRNSFSRVFSHLSEFIGQ